MNARILGACLLALAGCDGERPPARAEQTAPAPQAAAPAPVGEPAPAPPQAVVQAKPVPAPALDLVALMAGVEPARRIPVLTAAAREALAAQRPADAIAAARLATTEPGATAREQLLLARCLFEGGRTSESKRELQAVEGGLDALGDQGAFEEFLRLESQILAAFGNVRELARGLEAQADRLAGNQALAAGAVRIRHGYRVRVALAGDAPRQLLALWSDREDLSVITLPGAERPMLGASSIDLLWDAEPPSGSLVIFALDPAISTAPRLARDLPTLPVDLPSDEADRRPWRRFIDALRANPPAGGTVVALPPGTP